MEYYVLFHLKNNEKVTMNVVCCSRDWRLKGELSIWDFRNIRLCKPVPWNKQTNRFDLIKLAHMLV